MGVSLDVADTRGVNIEFCSRLPSPIPPSAHECRRRGSAFVVSDHGIDTVSVKFSATSELVFAKHVAGHDLGL